MWVKSSYYLPQRIVLFLQSHHQLVSHLPITQAGKLENVFGKQRRRHSQWSFSEAMDPAVFCSVLYFPLCTKSVGSTLRDMACSCVILSFSSFFRSSSSVLTVRSSFSFTDRALRIEQRAPVENQWSSIQRTYSEYYLWTSSLGNSIIVCFFGHVSYQTTSCDWSWLPPTRPSEPDWFSPGQRLACSPHLRAHRCLCCCRAHLPYCRAVLTGKSEGSMETAHPSPS